MLSLLCFLLVLRLVLWFSFIILYIGVIYFVISLVLRSRPSDMGDGEKIGFCFLSCLLMVPGGTEEFGFCNPDPYIQVGTREIPKYNTSTQGAPLYSLRAPHTHSPTLIPNNASITSTT
jgi:hypothetical protein